MSLAAPSSSPIETRPAPARPPLSPVLWLSDWLPRAEAAGVAAIPATFGPTLPFATLCAALDHGTTPAQDAALQAAEAFLQAHMRFGQTMWRWDCCAPDLVKHVMGTGRDDAAARIARGWHRDRWTPGASYLSLDDDRLLSILMDNGGPDVALCVRPWVPAVVVDGFPVEFRVYVTATRTAAVSSYYPQRPLDETWERFAQHAAHLALALGPHVPADVGYTADFLVRATAAEPTLDDLALLEGGPGWGRGAHPCCFGPDQLSLALARPAHTLPMAIEAQPGALIW